MGQNIFGGTELREPILISGKNLSIRLLSVYEALMCEAMWKNLVDNLINDGADKELSGSVSENACLASMCLYDGQDKRVFSSGLEALQKLTPDELLEVSFEYSKLRKKFLSFDSVTENILEDVKKKLDTPTERMRWAVLKEFKTLPSSKSAKSMLEGDYIYCYANMLLDKGEETAESDINPNFDKKEYERRRIGKFKDN